MSAVTLPPWLSPWSSGLLYGQHQQVWQSAKPERYRPRSRFIITLGHGNNAPTVRFSSWSEEGSGAGSPGRGVLAGEGGEGSADPYFVRWRRLKLGHEPWQVDIPVKTRIMERPSTFEHVEYVQGDGSEYVEGGGSGGGSEEQLHAWSGVVRGWAAGATLLALLVVLVRVGEKLLDWKILLRRRRLNREWPTANVRATSRLDGTPPIADPGAECTVEMPPPYSACGPAPAPAALTLTGTDERGAPPPPYSDVVTQFFDPNGQPVLLYSRDPPRDPTAPPSAYESEDSQRAIARLLRAYGIDGPTLPPPDDDARLFRHVYQAFSGIAVAGENVVDNEEDEANANTNDNDNGGTEREVLTNNDDANANVINDDPTDDVVVKSNDDDPKDGSVVV